MNELANVTARVEQEQQDFSPCCCAAAAWSLKASVWCTAPSGVGGCVRTCWKYGGWKGVISAQSNCRRAIGKFFDVQTQLAKAHTSTDNPEGAVKMVVSELAIKLKMANKADELYANMK